MNSGWIVWLVIAAVVFAGGGIAVTSVKRRLEQFSTAAFGTKSLAEGVERQADLLAETPKSVSGMTRIFAPQIARDFPDFQVEQFRNKAENLLTRALQAVSEENADLLGEVSPELRRQVENQIRDNCAAGIREVYAQIRIHRTEIADYRKAGGMCIITFQSAVECYHYKEQNGAVTEGDRERKTQTKYNTELMYIQDERLAKTDNAVGTTCPNCGAPVITLGNMRCEYCGLAVTPLNIKVWTLHRYYEVDYHHV